MARFLPTLLSTRNKFLIRGQRTFLPDAMETNMAWIRLFATINTNAYLYGINGVRQTIYRLLTDSRSLDEEQQRRRLNNHLHHLHQEPHGFRRHI